MTDRKLRVGIVSANWGALAHLPAWRLLGDDVEVTAMCTSREATAKAAAERFDVARPFWDYEAMCADPEIDIVDAGTNPILREKIVTCALNHGKHVVNQSPFAISAEAANRLAALQRERHLTGMVASSVMGLPHLALMKEMIDAGAIGEIYQVHCAWHLSFFLKIHPGFPYTWFGKAGQGVSVTRNHGAHMTHALRHLFGPIDAVTAQMQTRHKTWDLGDGTTMEAETDDTSHALIRFASGVMGTFSTSWTAAGSPGFHLDVFGSKGRVRLDALHYPSIASARLTTFEPNLTMIPDGREVAVPDRLMSVAGKVVVPNEGDMMTGGQRVSLARLFDGFVGAIRNGSELVPDFTRAAEVQAIIEAYYLSHERQAWVEPARQS